MGRYMGRYLATEEGVVQVICSHFQPFPGFILPLTPTPSPALSDYISQTSCQLPVRASHREGLVGDWQGGKGEEPVAPPHSLCSCSLSSCLCCHSGQAAPLPEPSASQAASVAPAHTGGPGFWTPGFIHILSGSSVP